MRFCVITFGSEGDTRPIAALCKGLMQAGHHLHLWADRSTLPYPQSQGVPCSALAGDMLASVRPGGALEKLMKDGGGVREMMKSVARLANENTAAWMETALEQARGADAILFSGLASYVALSVGEHLGIPAIGLGLWPISPTSEFPSPLVPPNMVPGILNRTSHRLIRSLMWGMFRKSVNKARASLTGQAPRRAMWDGYPLVYGISPALMPQPADWPAHWRVCGAWSGATDAAWHPPSELAAFLNAGPPPVYVGFGSMAGFDRDKILNAVIGALDGRRAVFAAGWSGVRQSDVPDTMLVIGPTPHDWLFPRMSTIVHHGGAGTTHSAARAGVPSVVVPFAADQFFWANRLRHLGLAPDALPHTRITALTLRERLAQADSPGMRERAATVATHMAAEDGIAHGVALVEEWVRASRAKCR